MERSASWPLVGRSEELALLDDAATRRRPAMVVAGEIGVGKSRLLAAWLSELEGRDRPTVVVRATRATATIPFGAFARWIPDHLGNTGDRLGVLLATVARLTEQPDLVVAVDDAQLLDDGSAALVLHLAQHTDTGLLIAVRSGEPCPDAIVSLWKEGLATRIDLQPLSEPQAVELVEHMVGDTVAPGTRRRLWRLTAGNPLYLLEVVEAALTQHALVRGADGWRWEGTLTEATRLTGLVSDRIGSCTPTERRVLDQLALGEPLSVDVLARLGPPEVLAELESRRLVMVDRRVPPEDVGVRLTHPLYGEALRSELPAFTARAHHRALADAGVAAGLHRRQPLQVAIWLLEAGADGDATADAGDQHPELLLRAAHLALMTDDHEMAARLAHAAARAGAGWRATLLHAEALGPLRRWDEAEGLLDDLSDERNGPETRAAAVRVRAEQSFWHRHEDVAVARRLLTDAARSAPPAVRSSLLGHAARYAHIALDLEAASRLADEALAAAESPEDRLEGLASAALAAAMTGRTTAALAMVRSAGPDILRSPEAVPFAAGHLATGYSIAAAMDGRVDEAAKVFETIQGLDLTRLGGSPQAMSSTWLAHAALNQGRVATAAALSRTALDLFGEVNHFDRATWIASTLAAAAAQCGDGAAAAAAIDWLDDRRRDGVRPNDMLAPLARAWVWAEKGELTAARQGALDVADRARAAGAPTLEVLALLDVLRFGGAASVAAPLARLTGVVEGRLVVTVADFAAAASTGDGDALDVVAARLAELGSVLLAAEAATVACDAHHSAGHKRAAAASRAAALRWHARCEGAVTPLLAGLRAAPEATTLSVREREVAGLAARGRTSRQIAQALTISVRTVDSHLNHVYTKLGISDRADLARSLDDVDRR